MSEWILTFKVFDTDTGEYVRNEIKKSFDELPLRDIEKRLMDKCRTMGWEEPRFNVKLEIRPEIVKK